MNCTCGALKGNLIYVAIATIHGETKKFYVYLKKIRLIQAPATISDTNKQDIIFPPGRSKTASPPP